MTKTQSLFSRNSQSGREEHRGKAQRSARSGEEEHYQERLHGGGDSFTGELSQWDSPGRKGWERNLCASTQRHRRTRCVQRALSCLERLGMKI